MLTACSGKRDEKRFCCISFLIFSRFSALSTTNQIPFISIVVGRGPKLHGQIPQGLTFIIWLNDPLKNMWTGCKFN